MEHILRLLAQQPHVVIERLKGIDLYFFILQGELRQGTVDQAAQRLLAAQADGDRHWGDPAITDGILPLFAFGTLSPPRRRISAADRAGAHRLLEVFQASDVRPSMKINATRAIELMGYAPGQRRRPSAAPTPQQAEPKQRGRLLDL